MKKILKHIIFFLILLFSTSAFALVNDDCTGAGTPYDCCSAEDVGTCYFVCNDGDDCNAGDGSGWSTGNDSNNGTAKSTSWATIQHAADTMSAGDTVIVGDGTYTDTTEHGDGGTQKMNLYIYNKNGSSGNEYTFQAENKWGAVLVGNTVKEGQGSVIVRIYRSSWIIIDGFEVKDAYWAGIDSPDYYTGSEYIGSTDVIIKNNKIHNIGRHIPTVTDYTSGRVGIGSAPGSRRFTSDRNVIYDIGRLHAGVGGSWDDFVHDHGWYSMGYGHIFTNNIVYNIYSGYHICLRKSDVEYTDSSRSHIVSNNVFAYNTNTFDTGHAGEGGVILTYAYDSSHPYYRPRNVLIQNNIVYMPNGGKFIYSRDQYNYHPVGNDNIVRNNVGDWVNDEAVIGDDAADQYFQTEENNTRLSNAALKAQMTDPDNTDFTLVATSSDLIDSGYSTSAPDHDFNNVSRPINTVYDIGPYERQSGPVLTVVSPLSQQSCGFDGEITVSSTLNSNLKYESAATASCATDTYATLANNPFTGGQAGTTHTVTLDNTCDTSTTYIVIGEDSSTGEDSNCVEVTVNIAAATGNPQPSPVGSRFVSGGVVERYVSGGVTESAGN